MKLFRMKTTLTCVIIIAAAVICLVLLSGCHGFGGHSDGADTSAQYGAQTSFEGDPHEACVMFVNVGKADCAIVTVDGHTWLVDTGAEQSFINVFAALDTLGVESIDGIIATHEHHDHVGGLEALSQKYEITKVVTPEYLLSRKTIDETVKDIGAENVKVRAGSSVEITEGVFFEILAPERLLAGDDNDNSIVAKLTVNGRSFLFTGDMQTEESAQLIKTAGAAKCDVLKVPNHGNPDGTSAAFAEAASPLISVFSTDTSVDKDSANAKVKARLSSSEQYITQDHELGLLLTVSDKGEISISSPARHEALSGLELSEASKADQTFKVKNTSGQAMDISGWFVYSSKGYEAFVFPAGAVIEAGGELTVACKNSEKVYSANYIWNVKKAWADQKDDSAVLCDPWGNEVSSIESN